MENNKPITIKAARGVRAKLWRNANKNGEWLNVSISRIYKDDMGEFQDSQSFSRDDLLHIAFVAQKAFDYIVANDSDDKS